MFDVAIYSKTALGRAELSERKMGLHPRLRHALIMVDGKTAFGSLRKLLTPIGDPKDLIQQLSDMRLIESDYDLPEMPDFTQSQMTRSGFNLQHLAAYSGTMVEDSSISLEFQAVR